MVLGPIHLQTLRKLKEQGPIKTGLHVSVSSLVKSGFVEQLPNGYFISETGHLALIAYGEMDDLHREIIMRLNSAAVKKRRYSKYALKSVAEQECFSDLLLWDLVDVDEHDGITLTDAGHKLWEIALKAHAFRDEQVADTIRQGQKESAAKKQERKADDVVPATAVTVIRDVETPVVTPPITQPASAGDCANCKDCIDAEVLELIAAKYPKVAELRDTLLKQKNLLKDLGL